MSLYLNQIKIPGHDLKITAQLTLAGEDMSGQGSHTPQAETGDKAKTINVSLFIRFANEADLKRIIALAEAKNANAERAIYAIQNQTANAMAIRQVRFQGSVDVREDETLHQWSVRFELIEYRSTAEKREARTGNYPVGVQAATGTPVSAPGQSVGLSGFEQVIKIASEILR